MWGKSQEPGDFYSHAAAAQVRHLIRGALLRLKRNSAAESIMSSYFIMLLCSPFFMKNLSSKFTINNVK